MYDVELLWQLINCRLSIEDIRAFFMPYKQEYDIDCSFDKYFKLSAIQHAIALYRANEISAEYLSCWASVYGWILLATLWSSKGDMTLKDILVYNIGEWLDSVSFFDGNEVSYESDYLDNFYSDVKEYFSIYSNIENWKAYYVLDDSYVDACEEVVVLLFNDIEKLYIKMEGFANEKIRQTEFYINDVQFKNKEKELLSSGYKNIGRAI